MMHIEVQPNTT